MGDKPFDPFAEEDELEFVPTRISEAPAQKTTLHERLVAEDATRIDAPAPTKEAPPLKLSFEELTDPGLSIRGASQIGSQELGSDDFLVGMKRRDYEDAMERARRDLAAAPAMAPDEGRVVREVRTPLYLLILGFITLVGVLVGGGLVVHSYFERQEEARLRAVQNAPR